MVGTDSTILLKNLTDVVFRMHDFQKLKDIKNQCITNSQFIYDTVKKSGFDSAKVTPSIVLHESLLNDGTIELHINTHILVLLNDTIIESSYDVASLKNKKYYFTYAEMCNGIKLYKHVQLKEIKIKEMILEQFLAYLNISKRMNSGEILVADKEYYHEQADFLET